MNTEQPNNGRKCRGKPGCAPATGSDGQDRTELASNTPHGLVVENPGQTVNPLRVGTGASLPPASGSTNYDSRQETIEHIMRVRELLYIVQNKLEARGFAHDQTKLGPNEKPIFDRVTGKLKGLTYGSDEYKASLKYLGPALTHHYANNSHHPEHYPNGVDGMSLLDVLEMLCDWKAAGERHADGSIDRSLTVNRGRFKISDQLHAILENTVRELGWSNDPAHRAPTP